MAVKQVAIRLKPEGGAETVTTFKQVEEAGTRAQSAVASAAEKATTAAERQEAQWRRNAEAYRAAANAADAQARFNTLLGVDDRSAARSGLNEAYFRELADEQRRIAQIRAEIDPLAAATDRYNAELREMQALQARGHLTAQEFARGQELAKNRLDATTAALGLNTAGLTRNQLASRLNLTRQAADVAVTAGMGMNPAMIALQQGPQVLDALATSGLKARGAMVLLGGAIGLAGGAAVTAGLAWKNGEGQALLLDRAVTGLGRTSGVTAAELEALAQVSAAQGEISVRSAREQAAAYVRTGKIGGEVIGGLIAIGKDYAAMFGLEAEEATQSLARAMTEPDKAARELTRQIGLLDQKTLDHIDTLVKHGDRLAAQKILLEALTGAVEGQADKIGTIESAWDAAARAVSNYWDKLGQALYTTPEERKTNLRRGIAAQQDTPTGRANAERMRAELRQSYLDWASEVFGPEADAAAANQAAQEAKDRQARAPRGRRDRSADREARERLARARAEEDRAHQIELEVARAALDTDRIRVLEEEAAIRTRIRQLVDADVSAEEARFKALQEQARLNEALAAATEREVGRLFEANSLEVDRILGMERYNAEVEREADLRERIEAYQETGLNLAEATRKAQADLLLVDQARAEVMARQVASAQREHQLTLARLAGRTTEADRLDRAARIEARAREIEARGRSGKPLNYGEGDAQAALEIGQEIAAEAEGVRRDWFRGFVADIRRGGIRDALADQFEQAADRLVNRLIDLLFDMDWSAILGRGGGGGAGDWISAGLNALFGGGAPGRNARGTDFWTGGWTWVGEEGPELIRAPRGAQIADADRSRRMAMAAARGAGGGRGDTHQHFYLDGSVISSDELWRRIERGDNIAARAGADRGAAAAVSTVHSTAPGVQRSDAMLRN